RLEPIQRPTRKLCCSSQLLFDAKELVVLRDAVGAARRAGLDLTRARSDGEVGDEGVLRLTGAMRDHGQVSGPSRHLDRLERLAQRTDLVDLDQDRVADT